MNFVAWIQNCSIFENSPFTTNLFPVLHAKVGKMIKFLKIGDSEDGYRRPEIQSLYLELSKA